MTIDSVFEKNMEVLEKRYPDLAKRVMETKDNSSYKLVYAKNGIPNVLINNQSNILMLYDSDDPFKYCDDYLERLDLKYAPIVVFMGLGLSYHLDRYFKLMGKKMETRQIIVFEKEIELFRLALKVGDFRQVITHPNIQFFVAEKPEDMFVKLRREIFNNNEIAIALKSLKIIPIPANVMLDDNDYYLTVKDTVKRAALQTITLAGNDSMDSLYGLENILLNLEYTFSNPGINTLYGKFEKKPAVLVASGPSLNKNVHFLNGLRERALIISCDSSFMPLIKNGIRPHLVTSLERTPGVRLYFEGFDNFKDIYFIAPPILTPDSIDVFEGRKFVIYRSFSHFDWLEEEKGSLIVGISVANLCFKILTVLGCDPIILVGQDLAYGQDGDTHANHMVYGSRSEDILKEPVIEIDGNYGKPVKSEKMWEVMKYSFEEDIAIYQGIVVNTSIDGARINGAEVMSLNEAIEKYCTKEFKPHLHLDEVYSNFKEKFDIERKMRRIRKKTEESRKILEDSIAQFENALEMANRAEKEIIQPFLDGSLKEVDVDRLKLIEKRFIDLSESFSNNKILCHLMLHTLHSYDFQFSNQMCFLRDIYTDETCLAIARSRMIKDWFSIVGQLLVHTKCLLDKTKKRLNEKIALAV